MKRFVAALLSLLLVCCCCAGYADTDLSGMTDEELVSLRTRIDVELAARATGNADAENLGECEYDGMKIALLGYRFDKQKDGTPVAVFTYRFTNTTDEAESFTLNCSTDVFQGGIGCETAIVSYAADRSNNMIEVKSGASVVCETEYILHDTTSPIEVTVGFLWDYQDKANFTIVIPMAE